MEGMTAKLFYGNRSLHSMFSSASDIAGTIMNNRASDQSSDERQPFVLMVDGDETVSVPLRRMLESDGWLFFSVDTVAAAESSIATRRPDLVIIDVTIHREAGMSLARKTRAVGILVIVTPDQSPAALAGLAWPYLRKPFQPQQMLSLAREVLQAPLRTSV